MDDLDEKDEGIQGYLRLSVAVIGPGDKLKIHSASEESSIAAGVEKGAAGADDTTTASSLQLLIPPTVKQDLRFLVITLHRVGITVSCVAASLSCCRSMYGCCSGGS